MRVLAALLVLVLAACADAGIVQPDPGSLPTALAFDRAMDMPGAVEFNSTLINTRTVEPGEIRATPSGVIHWTGLVNEFAMAGDLDGFWYFQDKALINPRNGMGRSVAQPALVVVTASPWGVGTFECNLAARFENYPTDEFIQYGHMSGCHGTGDFEAKLMWASFTNEAHPGLDAPPYVFHGVIW